MRLCLSLWLGMKYLNEVENLQEKWMRPEVQDYLVSVLGWCLVLELLMQQSPEDL